METVVDVTIPADQFVLEETFEQVPDIEFEIVRFAVHSSAATMPFLWGETSQPDRLERALQNDSAAARARHLSRSHGRCLYKIGWTERAACVINDFVESAGSVLDARGASGQWTFQVLFPDRTTASDTFQTWCDDGIDPSLCRINNLSCRQDDEMGLSPTQHSTIVEAFQTDYYDVPRGTTLEELAMDFDVSHQALSERLRRGHAHLVERMLSESMGAVHHRP